LVEGIPVFQALDRCGHLFQARKAFLFFALRALRKVAFSDAPRRHAFPSHVFGELVYAAFPQDFLAHSPPMTAVKHVSLGVAVGQFPLSTGLNVQGAEKGRSWEWFFPSRCGDSSFEFP